MATKYSDVALVIGAGVRCRQPNGTTRTATVAYINEDNTLDLLYASTVDADGLSTALAMDEENNVPMARITLLKDFEAETPLTTTATPINQSKNKPRASAEALIIQANHIKEEAGQLFKVKDFEASYNKYNEALSTLGSQQPGVGCTVLVREQGKKGKKEFAVTFVPALISIVDESSKTVDVMYSAVTSRKKRKQRRHVQEEEEEEEEEEEDAVGMDRIYVLPPQTLGLSAVLQCKLHNNCGVCNLKLKHYSKAIKHASLAIAIAKYSHSKQSQLGVAKKTGDRSSADLDVWVKGFWIRGKAQVFLNHFKEAKADAKKILKLSGHENNEKAMNLLKLIEKRVAIANKKNKSLVKSMSEYIGVAMEQSGGGGGGGGEGRAAKQGKGIAETTPVAKRVMVPVARPTIVGTPTNDSSSTTCCSFS